MKFIPIRKLHNAEKTTDFLRSFEIRHLGNLLGEKEIHQELHRHDSYFILFLEKGIGEHQIDFIPYPVGDYSVFFMRPGQVHQLIINKGSTGYLMKFASHFYYPKSKQSDQLLHKLSNKNFCKLEMNSFKKLQATLLYILEEYTDKQEGYEEVIKANLGIFFIELMRQRKNTQNAATHNSPYFQERLDDFLELLETHFSTLRLASEYAKMMNLSSYQLNAITKSMLGKTSSELIIDRIILESKRLLLATSNQINQIADQLGYEDSSYFIRFFKKHTGYSPESFRNKFM